MCIVSLCPDLARVHSRDSILLNPYSIPADPQQLLARSGWTKSSGMPDIDENNAALVRSYLRPEITGNQDPLGVLLLKWDPPGEGLDFCQISLVDPYTWTKALMATLKLLKKA